MRVVLDTNVLLAALISPYAPPERIYKAWRAGRFELVTSTLQLDELRRVSKYPKLKAILPPHRVGTMINNIQHAVVLEDLEALSQELRSHDPNDDFLLAMAQTAQADYLVTGDKRAGLLQRARLGRTRIVTPGRFCGLVLR